MITGLSLFFLTNQQNSLSDEIPPGEIHDTVEAVPPVQLDNQAFVSLNVPLNSPQFSDTPVAIVNDDPVYLGELAEILSHQEEKQSEPGDRNKEYTDALERIIDTKLIALEANNIGLNETDSFKIQVEDFKRKTLQRELISNQLKGLEADPADVAELYEQMSREVKLFMVTFEAGFEAQKFLEDLKENDFDKLVKKFAEEGKIKEQTEGEYVKIKDLLPNVVRQVYSMKTGDVSKVFNTENGFIVFKILDSRFVEDPDVKKEATEIVLDSLRKQKAMEYGNSLSDKYVDFNEKLYKDLDFDKKIDIDKLKNDKRVIATVKGDKPVEITVADLFSKVEGQSFHGADKAQQLGVLNKKKDIAITNMLFDYTSMLEAHNQGLDQTKSFKRKVKEYENSILFSSFIQKAVLPEVKMTPEEVHSYYEKHIDEYASPTMLRMNSLVFDNREDAEGALNKLKKGADFNWVSANSSGLVAPDTGGVLKFDQNILSMTALPDDLQQVIEDAKQGDSLLYAPDNSVYYYVLFIEDMFPSEPQPYDQVSKDVAKKVYNIKIQELVDEWVSKLKEAYEVQIFLSGSDQ